MGLAAISIDLDSLYCYHRLYSLPEDTSDNLVYETGLERFVGLLDELGLKGTLFAVGRDLELGDNKRVLSHLAARGYEVANHSYSHDYRLTRLSDEAIRQDVLRGKEALEVAIGREVVGFRAPGYNINEPLMRALEETGHRYDSSLFPCTPYYLTKASVLAAMKLSGQSSHSILGAPQVLATPRGPYRPNPAKPWRRGTSRLIELPISTTPVLRLPALGSFLVLLGERFLSAFFSMLKADQPLIVVEFHGMDFLDGKGDGLNPALLKQPDVAVPWDKKQALFKRFLSALAENCEIVTCATAAARTAQRLDV